MTAATAAPPLAGPATKRYRRGTHRVCPPEQTWERIAPLLPLAGISRVADVTRLDVLGVPVWQAIRPTTRNLSVSQGKGVETAAARVSAAMESLELWHAEDLSALPAVTLTPREMRFANPVPEESLRWAVPPADRGAAPLAWVRARGLGPAADGWLPRDQLELDFTWGERLRPRWFHLTSSGLASGNCREEALLHGLCELVERHALARGPLLPIARDSLPAASAELLARWEERGARCALWDASGPAFGLPVVVVDLAGPDLPLAFRGSGCHPAREVALSRALTEAAQSRLTYISGAREDVAEAGWDRCFSAGDGFAPPPHGKPFAELPDPAADDVAADLAGVVGTLAAAGHPAWWVDLARPDLGLPVTFCFAAGLTEASHD